MQTLHTDKRLTRRIFPLGQLSRGSQRRFDAPSPRSPLFSSVGRAASGFIGPLVASFRSDAACRLERSVGHDKRLTRRFHAPAASCRAFAFRLALHFASYRCVGRLRACRFLAIETSVDRVPGLSSCNATCQTIFHLPCCDLTRT